MQILKYIIIGLALLILILIAIFGIDIDVDPPQSNKVSSYEPDNADVPSTPEVLPEPEKIKLELTQALVQTYPFLSLLPKKPIPFDVNRNGFRDDLEIYIAQKFPHSPHMRAVYIQVSKAFIRSYTDEGRTKTARQVTLLRNEQLAVNCFFDNGFTEQDLASLKRFIFVDKHKVEGYQATVDAREEIPVDLIESIELPENSCDPILMENERMMQSWQPEKQ